ncbi:MAG TPA: DUF3618 domain-containing protein [Alphaproteobacteria bacterium]|nr:DUF3618 domain-containing protein [Alphaproteobacteria bacterium]
MSVARYDQGPVGNGTERSAAELEQEAERIRGELDRTLGQIEHRLSPNRLLDQALMLLRGGPGAFASNLGRTVRRHPVPTAMLAASLGWLLLMERGDKARSPTSTRPGTGPQPALHFRETSAPKHFEARRGADHVEGEKTMSGSWQGSRHGGFNPLGRHGSHGGVGSSNFASGARNEHGGIRQVGSVARHQVERARTGFEHMLDEQPLVLGAVAVALGAVLGATLPTSRLENRYLGPARERLRHRAGDFAREQWEKAKEVAASAGAAAMAQAEEQGMTPGSKFGQTKEKPARVAETAGDMKAKRRNLGETGGGE